MNGERTTKIKCSNCAYFRRIYRRGLYGFFLQSNFLYCAACRQYVSAYGICEKWKKKKSEYDLSPCRFDRAEENILFLLRYFMMYG